MIAEFSIVPIGKGESLSGFVAECIKIVKESGVKYQLTPMCTILEGEYDEVMDVIKKCHMKIMSMCDRALTSIKIDDRKGRKDAMTEKVKSVKEKIG
jgi:uncharacterized protein (TIGR00106 family)